MSTTKIEAIVEELFQEAVLADLGDLRTLAGLIDRFEEVEKWARESAKDDVAQAMSATTALIQDIILEEVENAEDSLNVVRRSAETLDGLFRKTNGSSEAVSFPEELFVDPASRAEGKGQDAQSAEAVSELPAPFDLSTGDTELLGDFIIEANEHLENADVSLLTLETEPGDEEAINATFRAFHTIKGVAGFMGLEQVQSLSHETENLLDKARKGELVLKSAAIDVVFEATDRLRALIESVRKALDSGELLQPDEDLPTLLARIVLAAAGQISEPEEVAVLAVDTEKPLGAILVETGVASQEAVVAALEQQLQAPAQEKLGEVLVQSSVSSRKDVDDALKIQKETGGQEKLGEVLIAMGSVTEEDVKASLAKQRQSPEKPKLGELLVRSGEVNAKEVAEVLRRQKGGGVREVVKVDSERLDRLVDMIGELVIAQAMATQSVEFKAMASPDVLRQLGQLDKIMKQLQETGMSLRMVPLRSTFQKMARLVRDLGKKSGKKVECIMVGEDTELDKTVVDQIGDPLIHMVRNSVDHGLEASPEERRKAGKPEMGSVTLRSFHREGNLIIEIEDDGRGLDREAILEKALEKGLLQDDESLSDGEVWKLIFEPGFSTAKVVTDVSGRGVGMDVVRRNIEGLRGKINIKSEKGKGTVFSIQLPLTLAIIDGMIVRVGKERFIIPTLSITQSIQPKKSQINTVINRGEMLSIQGELILLIRIGSTFGIADAVQDPTQGLVVVVDYNGKRVGLLVDTIVGQQQIVIKPLGDYLKGTRGLSGGAIMPDGNVSLIIDVGGFVDSATSNGSAGTAPEMEAEVGNMARAGQ